MFDPVNENILLALLPVMEGLAPSAALIVNPDREIDKLELFTPEYEPLATIIVSPSEAIEIADFKSPKGFSSSISAPNLVRVPFTSSAPFFDFSSSKGKIAISSYFFISIS